MREDWVECTLNDIAIWGSGGTPKSTNSDYYNGDIPWLIIGDLNDGYVNTSEKSITKLGLENSSAKLVKPNSILIAMYGSIGKLGINTIEVATNQAIAFTKFLPAQILNKYLFHYLFYCRPKLHAVGKGGTQKNISQTVLKQFAFPLIPLPEQRAIVAKIEELFSSLDQGIADLKKAQDQLKVYRQAVLKKAFEGELTKEKAEPEIIKLGSVIDKPRYGTSKKCSLEPKGIAVLRIPNIGEGLINPEELKYAEFDAKEISTLKLQEGDILTIRSNGSVDLVGKCALITKGDVDYLYAGYLIRLRPDKELIDSKFLLYSLKSHDLRVQIESKAKSTSGVNNINSGELASLEIPHFKLETQHQIVQEIESRLSVCDKVEESITESLEKATALRQSILKKAFEGTLLSEEEIAACKAAPDYEPASVLLERIKKEKKKK
jgi:type I restriction enzyme S subunit